MTQIRVAMILALTSTCFLYGWGGSEATTSVDKKQKTNFYGTLKTQQGNTSDVENISIEGKFKQIPVYERPHEVDPSKIKTKQKRKESIQEIPLEIDPSSELVVTYIDLNELKEIRIPHANQEWVYQRENSKRTLYYIEITVVSKGGTATNYLISRSTKIWCHGITDSGPEEKKVPLPAVDTLTIDGFCVRDDTSGQCLIPPAQLKKNTSPVPAPTKTPEAQAS